MSKGLKFLTVAMGLALFATACSTPTEADSSGDSASDGGSPSISYEGEGFEVEQIESTPKREDFTSALHNPVADGLPEPLVDPTEIQSGGPPPDGIPPIDDPKFLEADDVDFLEDNEPVLGLEINGEARAYPIQIMIWHEVVNDTVGGDPVTVTYCPLCNSAVAVDRRVGDEILDFGTSGLLFNSSLVMYDRQSESLWTHFTGEAVAGEMTGTTLETVPLSTVSWKEWREANPDTLVLSRDTGETRPYGQNPYPGYDDVENAPFLFEGEVDGRLSAQERVLGISSPTGSDDAAAIALSRLQEDGVVAAEIDGVPVVAFHTDGTASALEAFEISEGRDVGATGVFKSTFEGQELTFTSTEEGFVDDQTSSVWNVLGEAQSGSLAGSQLEPLDHIDTFWFAWGAFNPETELVT